MDLQVGIIQAPKSLKELKKEFFDATRLKDINKVRELLEMINVDSKNRNGSTALMLAGSKGHKDIIKLLLEYGADVDIQDDYGWTALMRANIYGHKDIVKLLKEAG